MRAVLLVLDVQNDFCEGGSLAVTGGSDVAAAIARHVGTHRSDYEAVASTRDWHVDPGEHFASSTGVEPDFTTSWPDHCVAGTPGAQYHAALADVLTRYGEAEFLKGAHAAAYSGFEGTLGGDGETWLVRWLGARDIHGVVICGIATDYCVRATALDALQAGFPTTVMADLCAGVSPDTSQVAWDDMRRAGVHVVTVTPGT